jgi:hypothetical protein
MLPLQTPATKGKNKNNVGSSIDGHLMDLAEDKFADGTSTAAENDAGTNLLTPTQNAAGMTQPLAPTGKETGMTPEMPTNRKQKSTPNPDQPATQTGESSNADGDGTTDEEYVIRFLQWLALHPDSK